MRSDEATFNNPNADNKILSQRNPAGQSRSVLCDNAAAGFGLKVTPRGKKVFIFKYHIGRRTQRQTLGEYGDWTVYGARKEAECLRGLVGTGGGPASEK